MREKCNRHTVSSHITLSCNNGEQSFVSPADYDRQDVVSVLLSGLWLNLYYWRKVMFVLVKITGHLPSILVLISPESVCRRLILLASHHHQPRMHCLASAVVDLYRRPRRRTCHGRTNISLHAATLVILCANQLPEGN